MPLLVMYGLLAALMSIFWCLAEIGLWQSAVGVLTSAVMAAVACKAAVNRHRGQLHYDGQQWLHRRERSTVLQPHSVYIPWEGLVIMRFKGAAWGEFKLFWLSVGSAGQEPLRQLRVLVKTGHF